MIKSKLSKNGTINLPSEIRKLMNIEIGDHISFIIEDNKVILVPIKPLEELIDPKQYSQALEIIEELKEEHRLEASQ